MASHKTRTKETISLQMKREIIDKYEQGARVVDLCREYGRSSSTICTMLKKKEIFKAVEGAKGASRVSKQRPQILEELERVLLIWIENKQTAGDPVTETLIREKALRIYGELQSKNSETPTSSDERFRASHGWFDKFRRRSGIQSVVRHQTANSDEKAAGKFIEEFQSLVNREQYMSHEVFDCVETSLSWKKMPRRTYITAEEKSPPHHKPVSDRLAFFFCDNSNGDLKLASHEPQLFNHSENLHVFKKRELKTELQKDDQKEAMMDEDTEEEKELPTSLIRDALGHWESVQTFVQEYFPKTAEGMHCTNMFNDIVMSHFRKVIKSRTKQVSSDCYIQRKRQRKDGVPAEKRQKIYEMKIKSDKVAESNDQAKESSDLFTKKASLKDFISPKH